MEINYKDRESYCPECETVLDLRGIQAYIEAWTPETISTQCVNCHAIVKFKIKYLEAELTVTLIPDE